MNKTLLTINSSGRKTNSLTRNMVSQVINHIQKNHESISVINRDVASGVPFVDESWIDANFTPDENRKQKQIDRLKQSSDLVNEIEQADILVIGSPIYNFSIPAVLKAWVDQIARARLTFKYTDLGPIGLMTGKKAILVMASGGVPIGSELDFATPYLKQVMKFIGITDVTVIDANHTELDTLSTQLKSFEYNDSDDVTDLNKTGALHV